METFATNITDAGRKKALLLHTAANRVFEIYEAI